MRAKRFSEGEVFKILQEVDGGRPEVTAVWDYGACQGMIHRWEPGYGELTLTRSNA